MMSIGVVPRPSSSGNPTRRALRWAGLLGVLALLWTVGCLPLFADDDGDDGHPYGYGTQPFGGKVVQVSWRGDDFFVWLDVTGDSTGDVWVKIKEEAIVRLPNGAVVPLWQAADQIRVGTSLTVVRWKLEHGYYEAYEVIVGQLPGGSPTPPPGLPVGAPGAPPAPAAPSVQGTVTVATWFGDDFFVGLDTNGDGRADVQVKIKRTARIVDPQGNPLGFDAIRPGVTLTLVGYKLDDDGYYEAWHVIVGRPQAAPGGPPATGAQPPLTGRVLQVIPFVDDLLIWLDADDDRTPDYPVRVTPKTQITDPQGNPLGRDVIQVGVRLRVERYTYVVDSQYYDAHKIVVEP